MHPGCRRRPGARKGPRRTARDDRRSASGRRSPTPRRRARSSRPRPPRAEPPTRATAGAAAWRSRRCRRYRRHPRWRQRGGRAGRCAARHGRAGERSPASTAQPVGQRQQGVIGHALGVVSAGQRNERARVTLPVAECGDGSDAHRPASEASPAIRASRSVGLRSTSPSVSASRRRAPGRDPASNAALTAFVTAVLAVALHPSSVRWASIPVNPPDTTRPTSGESPAGSGTRADSAHAACSETCQRRSAKRSTSTPVAPTADSALMAWIAAIDVS